MSSTIALVCLREDRDAFALEDPSQADQVSQKGQQEAVLEDATSIDEADQFALVPGSGPCTVTVERDGSVCGHLGQRS